MNPLSNMDNIEIRDLEQSLVDFLSAIMFTDISHSVFQRAF